MIAYIHSKHDFIASARHNKKLIDQSYTS